MHALVAAGADVIELGAPFSDPMADGPVIQKAGEAALANGMTLSGVLDCVRRFRQQDQQTPIVLMGYLNPIEAMGYEAFTRQAGEAGVDGLLVVDMPPEEAGEFIPLLQSASIDPIFLLAPTSSEERIRRVAEVASGYVYYVSLKGTTGSAALNVASVEEKLLKIREYIDLPIGVGFGIKDAASAAAIARIADAAVVGTVLVALMTEQADDPARMEKNLRQLIHDMRQAMDRVQ
jgi:tryptophan synthase alpha chain